MNVPQSIQRNVNADLGKVPAPSPWKREERRQDGDDFAPLVPADEAPDDMPEDPEEPKRKPLEEIAALMRALTYGEMMELAAGFWNAKPEGEMTPEAMAPTLHRWSQTRE